MKIIDVEYPGTLAVEILGVTLPVPNDTEYMAIDSDGELWAYPFRPMLSPGFVWVWQAAVGQHIADVDLEDADMLDTLFTVVDGKALKSPVADEDIIK